MAALKLIGLKAARVGAETRTSLIAPFTGLIAKKKEGVQEQALHKLASQQSLH